MCVCVCVCETMIWEGRGERQSGRRGRLKGWGGGVIDGKDRVRDRGGGGGGGQNRMRDRRSERWRGRK